MNAKLNPDLYHGKNKKDNFFEGWYFKITSKDKKYTFALIPGISLSNDSHCFVQILQGEKVLYNYCRYPIDSFSYSNNPFHIKIDKNYFSLDGLFIDISQDNINIIGSLSFHNIVKWKDSIINPGSMGFYNYLSFMECYSQVCALNGDIKGTLTINDEVIDFNGGKIYIEKNWGKSFPVEWLWIQSNCFNDSRATVTCSLGEIPFPIKNFRGFLIGVTIDDRFYKFTTINRSKISLSNYNNDISLTAIHKNLKLSLKTSSNKEQFMLCYGPIDGKMTPYVRESLTATVEMELIDMRHNKVIYNGVGNNAGIEYGGNLIDSLYIN